MNAKEMIAILESLPPETPVLIKYWGCVEKDEDATFEDIAHTEIERVAGREVFAVAGF